jgi:carbonic anhydrase/acetyltransferase-like protein (isoleucine patch superfamily)
MKPTLLTVNGHTPSLGSQCKLAPGAVITGDVICGNHCSFWFHSVVRGDVHSIRIGDDVNVQDHALIHCTYQLAPTTIGDRVSIGHRAILHGCTIHSDVLVGMGAIVMDHALVESGVIIGAGAVVTENMHLKSGFVYAGIPAKAIKPVSAELTAHLLTRIANNYSMYSSWYGESFYTSR